MYVINEHYHCNYFVNSDERIGQSIYTCQEKYNKWFILRDDIKLY